MDDFYEHIIRVPGSKMRISRNGKETQGRPVFRPSLSCVQLISPGRTSPGGYQIPGGRGWITSLLLRSPNRVTVTLELSWYKSAASGDLQIVFACAGISPCDLPYHQYSNRISTHPVHLPGLQWSINNTNDQWQLHERVFIL